MASNIPVIVQGNSFSLAIPLQIYYINGDQMDLQDYTPDPTDEVSVQLKGSRRNYTYTPTIDGNVANIDLSGNELSDNYGVVVSVVKANGQRLRSFRTDQFFIVESSDDLTTDDIIQGLEENVIYLNSSIFVAGEDGRGIESIAKTGTSGLVDTYTITYTDATTSTFNVTNGEQGEAGATIASVEKTATAGKVDTYTITMTDGNTFNFEVTNGLDGVDLGLANIVNDLTTGGATNVLSAEQGKVLGDAVFGSGTRTINYADLTWTSGKGVTNTGSYVSATNYYASQPFALEAGDQLSITVRGSSISVIAKYENGTYTPVVTLPPGTPTNVDQHLTHTITTSGNYVATCLIQVFSMVVTSATPTIGLVDLVKPIERHTVNANIILEGGSFRTGDGIPYYPITARTSFTRTSHTAKFIKFNSSIDEIKSVTLETGEAIYYFCYGEDKAYLGYTQNSASLPVGTRYIKIAVTHPSELTARRKLAVTLDYSADHIVFENNVGNGINPYYFAYECPNVPIVGSDISGSTYGGDQTRRFDMGYVMLPPNYTPDGDPVPLVLFFHGSGMFKWKGGTATGGNKWQPIYSDTAPYIDLLTFICKCGYAVADCCAMTDKYSLSGDYGWDFKCAPIGLSCYASLYNYLIGNFNLRTDGVYAFGKSAGGTPTLQLAYNKGIPLRAIANMTPALEPIGTFRYSLKNSTNWLLGQFGYVNPNVQAGLVGSGDVAYVKANINNIKGWDAFTMGTDIDLPTLANAWYKYGRLDSSMPDLQAIIDVTPKYQPVPMKMWASEDDDATPYLYMAMYKKMVDNGNGICILRTMPNNTGKHMSVDGSSAIRCDYQTKYGGVVNTTVAFAEMIDWFNRW